MRKIALALSVFLSSICLFAANNEDGLVDGKFKVSGVTGLNMSQTAMSHWAAGGENSYAGTLYLNGSAQRKSGNWLWGNTLELEYGLAWTDGTGARKVGDKFNFATQLGYSTDNKWFYTAMADFKTQFAKGYNYNGKEKGQYISRFMAPGYSKVSLGVEYRPKDWYSLYLSPVTGKMTFVQDDYLSSIGAFGVDIDKKFKAELGASFKGRMEKEIVKNVSIISTFEMFTAYDESFGNVDFDWDMLISMKVNKFLSATINTTLKYDDDIKSVTKSGEAKGPRVQFKEVLGIGLSYNF